MSLNKLVYLAHLKNEINRRRRRFYKMYSSTWSVELNAMKHPTEEEKITGLAGYEKAKQDMKDMTTEMRCIRKDIGARIEWGDSGNIRFIQYGDVRVEAHRFKHHHDIWVADSIILGDE